jgi:periplasmic protein CpxP/Spy
MLTQKVKLPTLALAALLAGTALPLFGTPAQAQTAQAAAPAQPAAQRPAASRGIEARIAALKAALKITDAQAPQFDRVAQAMRDNAKEMAQLRQQERSAPAQRLSAIDRLAARQRFDALRAQEAQKLLDAFTPLYAGLSDAQKGTADTLFAPRPRRRA